MPVKKADAFPQAAAAAAAAAATASPSKRQTCQSSVANCNNKGAIM